MISYQNFPKLYVSLSELIWATNGSWILSFLYSGTISWDFQLNNSPTESQLTIFLYPKFKIYDMIMVSLRIIKYCYDSPMENEIETVWSQNNIIFKASPPIQTHFLNQNLWEWEKNPNLAPRLWTKALRTADSGQKFLSWDEPVNLSDLSWQFENARIIFNLKF